jgi:hypothetical protein
MSPLIEARVPIWESLVLKAGGHTSPESGMCVMEAVAYVAGEPWSDHPVCACPVIGAFLRSWNDGLRSDEERTRLLKPLVLRLVESKSTPAVEEARAYLALDWLIRTYTPVWLDLVPGLQSHAQALRALEAIRDISAADAAGAPVHAAGAAAWAAAGDAARDAARAAAWAAAGDAARDAARAAPVAAAGAAPVAAAWAAARDAARAAAGAAAGDALDPAVATLQASALDLVDRMLAITPERY